MGGGGGLLPRTRDPSGEEGLPGLGNFKARPEIGLQGTSNAHSAHRKCRLSQHTSPGRDPCKRLRPGQEAKLCRVLHGTQHWGLPRGVHRSV